jgi:hypothetical protein
MAHDNHGGPARARKQTEDSGKGAHPDTTTVIDKGMKHHQHLFGSHNLDGLGGAKETDGNVAYPDEAAVKGGEASRVGTGARGRRSFPHDR